MSQRERMIMILTVAVLGLWVADGLVFKPVMAELDSLAMEKQKLESDTSKARKVRQEKMHKSARWQAMLANGLMSNPSAAESQILRSIGEWADEARLNRVAVQTEPSREKTALRQMNVTASFTGRMEAVTRFMYLAESSQVPVRIKQVLIESKREGSDEVSLSLRLSTLYRAQDERGGKRRG